jgi:transcriptional regulator with XRE-family HTH domain
MDKQDFIKARAQLGLTGAQVAQLLRLGKGSDRTIRRYESGATPIPGPVAYAVEAMLAGFFPEEYQAE